MTPQDHWLLQKEKGLAWLRVAFAVVAMAVVQINPLRIARFPLLSYLSLSGFLLYSVAILYLVRRENPDSRKIGFVTTCLDLVWVSLIVFSTGAARTPFFVYYQFPVITASSRYGIKGGLSAAFAGIILYGYVRFGFAWESPLEVDIYIVRTTYLVVLAYMFGFISEFENKQNQRLLALSKTAAEVATLEERRRIMRELHDGLLQTLATQILRLEGCRRQYLTAPGELDQELRALEDDTRNAMKEIREFLAGKEIRAFPPGMMLEKLREDLKFMNSALGLRVLLETEPENLSVPEAVEQDLYFVLREALMNVTRHSQASRTEIILKQGGEALEGSLSDDGVGFVSNGGTPPAGPGLGLITMKERMEKNGGKLLVESSPGKGTRISFVLPLRAKVEAA
ncbi:MAG TPA: sensor histidine kinase [candidate division Zixibacteria bacterium]|nr:sensor histidine kinase [candidate division Zixibacteria bacterium]